MFTCGDSRHFGLILILCLCAGMVAYCSSEEYTRKYCLPGSSCWPSIAAWKELNVSLGGRLLAPSPPGSPCHDGPNRSPGACQEAYDEWHNPLWRGDQAGAMQWPNWEWNGNQGCPLTTDPSTPCYQGSVPVYAVEALQASHVQNAIRFAARYRVRLSIKTTGHDFCGRSTAAGSLGIWLHRLRQITFHDSFSPAGCTAAGAENHTTCAAGGAPAVTAEVGVLWRDLYAAVDARQRIVVGGWAATLSTAGGYMQGGGHSPLSPMLGLCADNVLEVQVVTADGELRTANRHQNADLFWALRGGGGGTFGVVISATHKTHPPVSSMVSVAYTAEARDESSFRGLVTEYVKLQAALSDAGDWAGSSYVYPNQAKLYVLMVYVLPNGDAALAEKAFDPIPAYARQSGGKVVMVTQNITEHSTFLEWHRDLLCTGNPGVCSDPTGANVVLSSRLFPKAVLTQRPSDVADAFLGILSTGAIYAINGLLVAGRAVSRADVDGSAVNPAWRQALWHVVIVATWADNATLSEKDYKARSVTEMNGRYFRSLTPGSGCYLNEADLNEPDWQQSFFGGHYRELLRIKRKVDPRGLFNCRICVGRDRALELCTARTYTTS